MGAHNHKSTQTYARMLCACVLLHLHEESRARPYIWEEVPACGHVRGRGVRAVPFLVERTWGRELLAVILLVTPRSTRLVAISCTLANKRHPNIVCVDPWNRIPSPSRVQRLDGSDALVYELSFDWVEGA